MEKVASEFNLELHIEKGTKPYEATVYEVFEVMSPVRKLNWEDFESGSNIGRSVSTLAREITDKFDLCGKPQTFDLFERSGIRALVTLRFGDTWLNRQSLTFIRKHLLDGFLSDSNSSMLWEISGERRFHSQEILEMKKSSQNESSYSTFREFKVYI